MKRALTLAILLLLPLNALGAVVGKVELFGLKWTKRELVLRELPGVRLHRKREPSGLFGLYPEGTG